MANAYLEKRIEKLRAALEYLIEADIPHEHRETIIDAVRGAHKKEVEWAEEMEATENSGKRWTDEDIAVLRGALPDIARSHEEGRANIERAALRLRRGENTVKRKAREIGLSDRIDYWYARELHKLD